MRQRQFTKSLSVALSQEQFEQIKQITDEEQISMADWVRNVIETALLNHKKEKKIMNKREIIEEKLNHENLKKRGELEMGYGIFDHVGPLELERNLLATACKLSERESDRLEMVEDFKEELKRLNKTINYCMKKQNVKYYYLEYVRLGGKSVQKQFKKHLRRFFELTYNAYVYKSCLNIDGTCCNSKYETWIKWTQYLNNCDEANLYMVAIYKIRP